MVYPAPVLRLSGSWEEIRPGLGRLGLLAIGVLSIVSYAAVGRGYYDGFRMPQGTGMNYPVVEELAYTSLFLVFGTLAVIGLAGALEATAWLDGLAALVRRAAARPAPAVGALALAAGLASGAIGAFVLGHAVVTDDEHTYRFIAQTLRTGALTAPSPGTDLDFFREQFVVLTADARYGKYPIGHPLLLAAGLAIGAESWVGPALTAMVVALVYAVGAMLFDRRAGLVAALLVATSPQVILTGATYLSQPAATVFLLAGMAALVAADRREGKAALGRLAVAGALLGYAVFVRPLPGVLFAAVAGLAVLWRARTVRPVSRRVAAVAAFGVPLALGCALILVQNRLQAGAFLTSGYQAFHATGAGLGGVSVFLEGDLALRAMSLVAGGLRLGIWAFGWPFAPLLALAALRAPRTGLLWALVGAAVAYRLLAPKTGVSATGPVYLYDVVPVLALLSAEGAITLARSDWGRRRVAALLVAGALVSGSMFVPDRLADLYSMGLAQRTPQLLLDGQGVRHAVVFQSAVVPWWTRRSWAYYPRCNSPALDDDVLFLHVRGPEELPAAREVWRRRFPDRSAWLFEYDEGVPRLIVLDQALREAAGPAHDSGPPRP
jgi:hypothetical protein